jgi:hypothetical protein
MQRFSSLPTVRLPRSVLPQAFKPKASRKLQTARELLLLPASLMARVGPGALQSPDGLGRFEEPSQQLNMECPASTNTDQRPYSSVL